MCSLLSLTVNFVLFCRSALLCRFNIPRNRGGGRNVQVSILVVLKWSNSRPRWWFSGQGAGVRGGQVSCTLSSWMPTWKVSTQSRHWKQRRRPCEHFTLRDSTQLFTGHLNCPHTGLHIAFISYDGICNQPRYDMTRCDASLTRTQKLTKKASV